MKLTIHRPIDLRMKNGFTATIYKSGRLSISSFLAKEMGIAKGSYVVVMTNDSDKSDRSIYLQPIGNKDDNGAFRVVGMGTNALAIQVPLLLRKLKIDYSKNILLVAEKVSYEDGIVFKLTPSTSGKL